MHRNVILFARNQQDIIIKQNRQLHERQKKQIEYCNALKYQMRANEEAKLEERKARFLEGVKLDEEIRLRRRRVAEMKLKKLEELR